MQNEITTEELIVQKQLDAYNQRDINTFLSCHSNTIEIYNFGESTPFISGIENLKNVYSQIFNESPNLKASIHTRIIFDNKVIDNEEVVGRKGVKVLKVIAIYEVELNVISKVTFIKKK